MSDTANQPQDTKFSFRTMGRALQTQIARTPMSEVLSKLEAKFAAIYEPYTSHINIKLLALDVNSVTEIAASLLVVAAQLKGGSDAVAYHTLILDGTGGDYPSRFESYNGTQFEIPRFTPDIWDSKLKNYVAGEVNRIFGTPNLIEMDATTIPRNFDIENDLLVRHNASNALIACNTELERIGKVFSDINLVDALGDSQLTTKILFNDQETYDILGKPLRADINIIMSASGTAQSQNPDRQTEVAKLSGFLDLIYSPATPPNANGFSGFGFGQPASQTTQLYIAQFVITSMETLGLQTTAAQLLALVQALMLRTDQCWSAGFRPRAHQLGDIDIHDIGALGYEAGPEFDETGHGKRFDTKSDRFRPEHFTALLQMWMQPGLSIAIDVVETGPQAWYNGIFAAAGQGSIKANEQIIVAANKLTNNAFGPCYHALGGTGRVLESNNTRAHVGTYRAPGGSLRSLQDIGYVEIMNLVGEKDLGIVKEWSDSWLATNIPQVVREATRKRILSKLLTDPVFEGMAVRSVYEAAFLSALAESCLKAGLSLKAHFPYSDTTHMQRATGQYAGAMLMGQPISGLFNAGYGIGGDPRVQGSGRPATYGRWGV